MSSIVAATMAQDTNLGKVARPTDRSTSSFLLVQNLLLHISATTLSSNWLTFVDEIAKPSI